MRIRAKKCLTMKNTLKVTIRRIAAIRRIAGTVALMAIVGFAMAACASSPSGSGAEPQPPVLTDFIIKSTEDGPENIWNPMTSISANQWFDIAVKGTSGDQRITKYVLTTKDGSTVVWTTEVKLPPKGRRQSFTLYDGHYWLPSNFSNPSVIFEVYFEDEKGNKSNTMSVTMPVN